MKPHLASALVIALVSPTFAGPFALRGGTTAEWETLFREGTPDAGPVGPTRGTVLFADDAMFPRMKARLQGVVWKGKRFHGDGTFTNRWVGGITAGTVSTVVEPSWLDGQPSLTANYPPTALVFRNVRDELRQVAPGVWLGRSYDATTGKPKNWFVLEAK